MKSKGLVTKVSTIKQLIVAPHTSHAPRNSEGDIIELTDGRLLLVWTEFYGGYADDAPAHLMGITSHDNGASWSQPFEVVENPGGKNAMSVSLVRDRAGQLLLFYLWKQSKQECQVMMRRSSDEAATWSAPQHVSFQPGYHVMNNARVILTSGGRLLAPVAHENQVYCYLSDDDGLSWQKSSIPASIPGSSVLEPGLIELKDGSILMIIRTPLGTIYRSHSHDAGNTWAAPQAMELVSPSSPATLARIPSTQHLLIVWNNQPLGAQARWGDRTPLTCAISKDEGLTWEHVKDIETSSDHCFAYTSIDFIKGNAYLTYYRWTKGRAGFDGTDLKLSIIPESWLYS